MVLEKRFSSSETVCLKFRRAHQNQEVKSDLKGEQRRKNWLRDLSYRWLKPFEDRRDRQPSVAWLVPEVVEYFGENRFRRQLVFRRSFFRLEDEQVRRSFSRCPLVIPRQSEDFDKQELHSWKCS